MDIKHIFIIASGITLLSLNGCDNSGQSQWDHIKKLEQENTVLKSRVASLENQNDDLVGQVQILSKLDKNVRFEAVATLSRIEITKRTALYDKDSDGKHEKLIVYLKPYDKTGDIIKAAGTVNLQLWDLNSDSQGALLGEWNIQPQELQKLWMGALMTDYFRLVYDIGDVVKDTSKDLTVKVKFTDYLTGKVFSAQKVIFGKI